MHIFYVAKVEGSKTFLSPEESFHCIRVLRLGKGDKVQLIDGIGGWYNAMITRPDRKQCELEISGVINHRKDRNFSLHIAITPTKSIERFEWFIEKSVEIGIDIITPMLCQRSERRTLKTDRLNKLIISTMKQAMIPYMPVLHELTDFKKLIEGISGFTNNRFIACYDESVKKRLLNTIIPRANVIILIGPEGDFTQSEIDLAISHDFIPVSLGDNRLRTETAGLVACNTVALLTSQK
jgi:16S rRNA (uracil1498-N3)-methyltransferase